MIDTKKVKTRRKVAYVYLMYRMFDGDPQSMLQVLNGARPTLIDLKDWDKECKENVLQIISGENEKAASSASENDVPSIASLREKVLRRIDATVSANEDPAKLAQVYKVLTDHQGNDKVRTNGVLDAINAAISTSGNAAIQAPGVKRGRGRPRKTPLPITSIQTEEQVEE